MPNRLPLYFLLGVVCVGFFASATAATVSDDFSGVPSLAWGNESGGWNTTGDTYGAASFNNFPNAYSSLPYDVTAFELDVDVSALSDGGVWAHSEHTGSGTIGVQGILLVTLGGSLYWHAVTDDSDYGSSLNSATHGGFSDLRVTAVVDGGGFTYSAFINGSMTALTSYTSTSFSSGRVALYSNSAQRFDNFELTAAEVSAVPLPPAALLLAPALAGLLRRRT